MSDSLVTVVWFKRDLRLADHRPLWEAAQNGAVLPLYIVEPSLVAAPDFDSSHWKFIHESLVELRDGLAKLGQPLLVRVDEVVPTLHQLREKLGAFRLLSHEETGNQLTYRRDLAVAAWANSHNIEWKEYPQNGVIRRLSKRDGWSEKWKRRMSTPAFPVPAFHKRIALPIPSHPIPSHQELGLPEPLSLDLQTGGERAAHRCLEAFLSSRGARYHREMSSPITSESSCSRLSPYLAWGCLSMKTIAQAGWKKAAEIRASDTQAFSPMAIRSFLSRCHWHCHFMQKLEDEPAIENHAFNPLLNNIRPNEPDTERLERWQLGQTGYPFLDACIRYLERHRWINFRMRAMLVSFAAYDLWIDWRHFKNHLARQFLDYEPGIHYSQIQMQSGTTGINTLRIYNPIKQGRDQDPKGDFIRRWVPELAPIGDERIHEPWTIGQSEQKQFGCVIGKHYPRPIIDHAQAVREARAHFKAVRQRPEFRELAQQVTEKHGSRKRSSRNRKINEDKVQLKLF